MLTENEVITAVSLFLEEKGFIIESKANTHQQGHDIIALNDEGLRLYVEAKGATSSKHTSNRFGKAFSRSQVKTHVGVALIKVFQTKTKHPNDKACIALPQNEVHEQLVREIAPSVKAADIALFFVNENGLVTDFFASYTE